MTQASPSLRDVAVIIPTYRAAAFLDPLIEGLKNQGIQPDQVLVIDSSSPDGTVAAFRQFGARVEIIPQSEFNHGGTRRKAAALCAPASILIYITQDAIPEQSGMFQKLVEAFQNPRVGLAYGCQTPRKAARAIERHARLYNYPSDLFETRSLESKDRLGVKATFCSDSFAAYRREALEEVGSFPEDAFFAEDQITAGKMLLKGWDIAYVGTARVTHSHAYTLSQEFKRYFDVGVFHARNAWLRSTFGRAEGEGIRFILSELRYLGRHEPFSIPLAISRTFAKYFGYRLGLMEARFSAQAKTRLSMSPAYWRSKIPD